MREMRYAYKILVGKSEKKGPLENWTWMGGGGKVNRSLSNRV
jgi:hypothetical protein